MSRYSDMARSERNQSRSTAYETPWPLPLRGILDRAKTSELSGGMAGVVDNWQSNGISLEMRDGYQVSDATAFQQRIAYEFGDSPQFINITSTQAQIGSNTFVRSFPVEVSHTTLSSNVLMADGAGQPLRCDGYQIIEAGFTTDTGKDASEFNGVFAHFDRPFFWDDSALEFYYGDIGAVTGELVRFPLDRLGNITGNVAIITSMTINAAHGMNDVLVIVTTTGMVILYEGLDPGDANDWRLLGRVNVAAPVSKHAVGNYGSDVWFLTSRGIASVRDSLANGILSLATSVGRNITDLLIADVKQHKDKTGWQFYIRQDGTQIFLNTPTDDGFKQYVFNTESQSWTTANYPARCWQDLNGTTEFTHIDGTNCVLSSGGDIDAPITATLHTSWIRLPRHSEVAYLIPTIIADDDLVVSIAVLTDHNETDGDIAQATQTVTLRPDNPGSQVSLDDIIGINAAGRVFQARFEITGKNVSFENLMVGIA